MKTEAETPPQTSPTADSESMSPAHQPFPDSEGAAPLRPISGSNPSSGASADLSASPEPDLCPRYIPLPDGMPYAEQGEEAVFHLASALDPEWRRNLILQFRAGRWLDRSQEPIPDDWTPLAYLPLRRQDVEAAIVQAAEGPSEAP